jgi:hypothetical protein
MNERILKLAQQAGFGWDDKYHWYVGSRQMEKFAELIVKECADLCSKYGDQVEYNRPNSGYESWEFADIIKQHFGVE